MQFDGRVALITGASNGIGRAAALAFAARGAKVLAVDKDAAGAERTAGTIQQQGGQARFCVADVTKSADVQAYVRAALDAFGSIDCFFNNAGIEGKVVPITEYEEAIFDQVIDVNVKGVFLGLRHAARHAETEVGRGREHRLGRGARGHARHVGLRCLKTCGDWPHQGGRR